MSRHAEAALAAMAGIPFMPSGAKDVIMAIARDVDRINAGRERAKVLIFAVMERAGTSLPNDLRQSIAAMLDDV